ncbi:MAG: hypothetical protein ABIM89_00465, partial [Mycobacteriales bacterium]
VDAIVANVPCVPAAVFEAAADAADHAYVGQGEDGLGLQRSLMRQALKVLRPGGSLVLQMAPDQWTALSSEAETLGYQPSEQFRSDIVVIGLLTRLVESANR